MFKFNYVGDDTIDKALKEVVIVKDINNIGLGMYSIHSLVTEQLNSKVRSGKEDDGTFSVYVSVPVK